VEYINNNKTKVKIICPDHGSFEMSPSSHLRNKNGCSKCSPNSKGNRNKFISGSKDTHGNIYDYSKVIFEDIRSKVKIICKKHGEFDQEPFDQEPFGHYQGQGCPVCKSSKGEKRVREVLDSLNINYKHQYKFEDCIGKKNPLPFYFFLPTENICIEYDKQHFEVNEFFGGICGFNDLRINDDIKTNYCLDNGIRLLRTPYTNFDKIEDIIKIELGLLIKLGDYKLNI